MSSNPAISALHHKLPFKPLDVFTSTPYAGNPLAIVAKEFNLSETVFLHESKDLQEWSIDIFIQKEELRFAGHPTIGSVSYALHLRDSIRDKGKLLTKAGPIPITVQDGAEDGKG